MNSGLGGSAIQPIIEIVSENRLVNRGLSPRPALRQPGQQNRSVGSSASADENVSAQTQISFFGRRRTRAAQSARGGSPMASPASLLAENKLENLLNAPMDNRVRSQAQLCSDAMFCRGSTKTKLYSQGVSSQTGTTPLALASGRSTFAITSHSLNSLNAAKRDCPLRFAPPERSHSSAFAQRRTRRVSLSYLRSQKQTAPASLSLFTMLVLRRYQVHRGSLPLRFAPIKPASGWTSCFAAISPRNTLKSSRIDFLHDSMYPASNCTRADLCIHSNSTCVWVIRRWCA
eukprot:SAG31_NODE_3163_length_4605_cov_15.046383_7_plen_288_part_00